jgi:hypothetical protein
VSNYLHGCDVLGADYQVLGEDMRVKTRDAAIFSAVLAAADQGAKSLGDNDPAFTLQPGDKVSTVGPEVKNSHGVSYTPVNVPNHDGLFFIRTSSLALIIDQHPTAPVVASSQHWYNKVPWWVWAIVGTTSAIGAATTLGVSLRGPRRFSKRGY